MIDPTWGSSAVPRFHGLAEASIRGMPEALPEDLRPRLGHVEEDPVHQAAGLPRQRDDPVGLRRSFQPITVFITQDSPRAGTKTDSIARALGFAGGRGGRFYPRSQIDPPNSSDKAVAYQPCLNLRRRR